jgi:hypothetical protein
MRFDAARFFYSGKQPSVSDFGRAAEGAKNDFILLLKTFAFSLSA